MGELAHAEVINDEQGHGGDRIHIGFARAIGNGVGEFVEQHMRFAIEDLEVLLDCGVADGLSKVTLAGAVLESELCEKRR